MGEHDQNPDEMVESIKNGLPFILLVLRSFTTFFVNIFWSTKRKENYDNSNAASGKLIAADLFSAIGDLIKK